MKTNILTSSKEAQWLVVGVVALIAVYFIAKKVLGAAGGILSGNNSLTAGTDYAGTGVLGTLGAATNTVLGGAPAAVGQGIGSGLYDALNPGNPGAGVDFGGALVQGVTYIATFPDGSRHAVDSSSVDASGNFTYQGAAYQLGIDGTTGQRVAYAR